MTSSKITHNDIAPGSLSAYGSNEITGRHSRMTPAQQLRARVATYRDPESRALIHFLIQSESWSIKNRLDISEEQAVENIASRALDFLADADHLSPSTQTNPTKEESP